MATFSSPAVAVAVAAADAADAVDAVAVVVADAVVALAGAPAALPGAHAAGAKRDHLSRVINTDNHGRVRHRRPGLCMCTSGGVRNTLLTHRDRAEFPPH